MAGIFVSYRRSDSQGESGRLFDDLVKHFGEQTVFMDVSAIEPGRDFRRAIEDGVTKCGALLVVMGPEWMNAHDESGKRRLDDPGDFVRIETSAALRRDIPVIPVLVRGSRMPSAEQLPDDLKELAFRNCIELTHARWRSDIQILLDALRRVIGDPGDGKSAAEIRSTEKLEPVERDKTAVSPIEAAILQRVSRELASCIGPIADIVVKRAATRCTSVEDLYLQVAQEIDSTEDREEFLRKQIPRFASQGSSESTVARATARALEAVAPMPHAKTTEARTAPTSPIPQSSSHAASTKYVLISTGGVVLVVLTLLGIRYSRKESAAPFEAQPPSAQITTQANSVARSDQPAPAARHKDEASNSPLREAAKPSTGLAIDSGKPASAATGISEVRPNEPLRVRVPQDVFQSLLVTKIVPVYPPLARQARIKGAVILDVDISKKGAVESVRTISGHPLLIPAAIDAVKQWVFQPYVVNGQAVPAETQVTVLFSLSN